jgi:hypothetical protein
MAQKNNSIGLNELVDYQKKTYGPIMDKIMRFLWKCGGADPQILQYSPYADHIKNAGIGGVVLATSVMASLAMGFAMHTIFASPVEGVIDDITGQAVLRGNWFITIPVSIVWGLIIFNLDRFIVSTVKGDGTENITWGEFKAMLPRLAMAILIGLTISAPLETYIFKREIYREWEKVCNKMAQARQYELEQGMSPEIATINQKLVTSDTLVAQTERAYRQKRDYIDNILEKQCNRGRNCPKHKDIYDESESFKLDFQKRQLENDSLKRVLADKQTTLSDSIVAARIKIGANTPGFLDQLMMLERLSAEGQSVPKWDPQKREIIMKKGKDEKLVPETEEIYPSAFWPIWLVRLLFMIVEIAPVIFKFMIWKSSYDYLQDNVAQILEAKQGVSLECITDENNNMHKVRENYNARRIIEVARRQNELEKENAIHAITLYAEKEREAIEKNPERFVKTGNDSTDSNVEEPSANEEKDGSNRMSDTPPNA